MVNAAARQRWRRRRDGGALVAAAATGGGGGGGGGPSEPTTSDSQPARAKNAGLYDLDEEAGWAVAVVDKAPKAKPSAAAPAAKKRKKKAAAVAPAAAAALASMPRDKQPRAVRMPYVDLTSQAGVAGLEMLRQSLVANAGAGKEKQEQQQQEQQQQQQEGVGNDEAAQRRAILEATRRQNRAQQQPRAKLPGMVEAAAAALAEREAQQKLGIGGTAKRGVANGSANNNDDDDDEEEDGNDGDEDDASPSVPEFTVTYSGDTGELESFKEKDPITGELREARAPWQRQQQQQGGRRVFVARDDDEEEDDEEKDGELGAFGDDLLADALGQYGAGQAGADRRLASSSGASSSVPLALAAWQDVLEEVELAGGWEQLEALPGGALESGAPAFRMVPAAPGAFEDFESTTGSAALFHQAEDVEDDDEDDEDDDTASNWRRPAAAALPRSTRSKKAAASRAAAAAAAAAQRTIVRQTAPVSGLARPDRRREAGSDSAFYRDDEEDDEDGAGGNGGAAGADEYDPSGRRRRRRANTGNDEDELDDDEGRAKGPAVVWGGTGGVTGLDLEEQAAVLARYFQPSEASKLLAQQRSADAEHAELRLKAAGKGGGLGADNERRLHRELRVLAGTAAGRSILSSRGETTRPMMAKVRGAAFSMVAALAGAGSATALPSASRWLDLFAGTGSIGIEALSRGAREAHFVEMDAWVARRVLSRNIAACGFERRAVTHTTRAEDFLRRAQGSPRFAGGAFDFVSVCPPYLLVSYPELFDLFEGSPLLGPSTVALVEYPKQLSHEVRATLGPLRRVRDRKYGRTYLALYAGGATAAGAAAEALAVGGGDDDDGEDDEDEDEEGGGGGGGGDEDGPRGSAGGKMTGWET